MTLANRLYRPNERLQNDTRRILFHKFTFTRRGGLEGEKYMPQFLFPLQRGYKGAEPL
jgi:hypothetical protein